MITILTTPPLSRYLDALPKNFLGSAKKVGNGIICANPECEKKLTRAQIKKGYKYHCIECGRTATKARNGALNGKGFKRE